MLVWNVCLDPWSLHLLNLGQGWYHWPGMLLWRGVLYAWTSQFCASHLRDRWSKRHMVLPLGHTLFSLPPTWTHRAHLLQGEPSETLSEHPWATYNWHLASCKRLRQNKKHKTSHNLFFNYYYKVIDLHPPPPMKNIWKKYKEIEYFTASRAVIRKIVWVFFFFKFLQETDTGDQNVPILTTF